MPTLYWVLTSAKKPINKYIGTDRVHTAPCVVDLSLVGKFTALLTFPVEAGVVFSVPGSPVWEDRSRCHIILK